MSAEHELLLPLVDSENICLPLPVNVVSRYWNISIPMGQAEQEAKKYQNFQGNILIEGIEAAQRHGLECRIIHSTPSELKEIIRAGIPPIVILPGIPEITQHASVITGFGNHIILHYIQKGTSQGEQQEGAIPEETFVKEWAEEGNLAILIAPPDAMSAQNLQDGFDESNRLCLASERSVILQNDAEAAESLKQAIKLNPNNPTALYLMGSLLNGQDSGDCTTYYKRCLKSNPDSFLSYNGLGNYYLKCKQYEKAAELYSEAIKINPKRSAKIYKNRAFVYAQLGRNPDAKADLRSYLKYYAKAPDRRNIEGVIRAL